MILRSLIPCAWLLLSAAGYSQAKDTLTLATYQYAENNRIANISPLAKQIELRLGVPVKVKSYPTVHAFLDGIRANETDIALLNTFGYLLLRASPKAYSMDPVYALSVPADAKDNYKTVFVASRESGLQTLKDVSVAASCLRLTLVAAGSTSGNLVPRLALNSAGIADADKTFLHVGYGKTHAGALDSLVQGKTDLAAFGHTEWEKLLNNQREKAEKLQLLWLSPEIPLGPVMLHRRLTMPQRQKLESLFLGLHQDSPQALESVKAGWSEAKQSTHYIRIQDTFYDSFRKQLGPRQALTEILTRYAN